MYQPNFKRRPQYDCLHFQTLVPMYAYEMTDYPRDKWFGDHFPIFWANDEEDAQRQANEFVEVWNTKELSWLGAFGIVGGVATFIIVLYGLGII